MSPKYQLMFSLLPLHSAHFVGTNDEARERFGNVIDPEKLPLSADTLAKMRRLSTRIRSSVNWDYLPDPGPWRQEECDRFNRAVREFLTACRRELGPEFEISENFAELKEDPDLDEYLKDPKGFMREKERSTWAEVLAALRLPEKPLPPGIRQVEPRPFPSGEYRPIAVIGLGPRELAARYGIRLQEKSWEDLAPFRFAAIELSNNEQVWLVRHQHAPYAGVYIYADAASDIGESLGNLTTALGLAADELIWHL